MNKLEHKKCLECYSNVTTFSDSPLCNICIKTKCELSHMKDSIGRNCCNTVVGLVKRKYCLCIGHYKMLQSYCFVCGEARKYDGELSYDNYYYCDEHKPIDRNELLNKILSPVLNADCIGIIVSKIK